jgi:hypothetical protein
MSFHCSDHAEYVRSWRKLSDETLHTLAEYFESIFLAQLSDGLIQRKHDEQLCAAAKHELCHELGECYRTKLKRLSESQEHHSSHRYQGERGSKSTPYGNHRRFKAHCSSYKDSYQDCKAPLEDEPKESSTQQQQQQLH